MAPSATQSSAPQPISQSYAAGSCQLDVSFTPSALSQWSAKPIVDALTFQLWLDDVTISDAAVGSESVAESLLEEAAGDNAEEGSDGEQKVLVAEGDRTQLQAIAQYFHSQTRNILALSALRASVTDRPTADRLSQPPSGLQLNRPLSYLQLCDIAAVLSQYEQATKTLPYTLSEASSSPASSTTEDLAAGGVGAEVATTPDNVIPLDAVRRVAPRDPSDFRKATARRTRRDGTRRRRKTGMWVSSAAAALFVVGLTTTLISRDPSLQDVSVTSDAPVSGSQQEASRSDESALSEKVFPDTAADLATEGATEDSDNAIASADDADESLGRNRSNNDLSGNDLSGNSARSSSRNSSAEDPTAETNRARSTRAGSTPAVDSQPASPLPGSGSTTEPSDSEQETTLEAAQEPETIQSAQVPSAEVEVLEEAEASSGEDRAFSPPVIADALPETAAGASRGSTSNPPLDSSGVESSQPAAPPPTAPLPAPSQSESSQPEGPQIESLRRPSPASPLPTPDAASAPVPESIQVPEDSLETPLDTSLQIQSYFQQRWQSGEVQRGEGPLTYRLQLSETGTVDSFIALDERSQASRDRLLPANNPPTFNVGGVAAQRAFRIVFNADGGVEVSPL